jgi:hypothetical protein
MDQFGSLFNVFFELSKILGFKEWEGSLHLVSFSFLEGIFIDVRYPPKIPTTPQNFFNCFPRIELTLHRWVLTLGTFVEHEMNHG